MFAIRFANSENANKFKEAHENAKLNNKKTEEGADAENTEAGDEAADALESLKVKELVACIIPSDILTDLLE